LVYKGSKCVGAPTSHRAVFRICVNFTVGLQ